MTGEAPGIETWKENTSAFDRVRSVAVTLSEPRSADWIADEAAVAGNTARDHLGRLVEMNVLQRQTGAQATLYQPDPLYTRLRSLRDLLDGRDRDDLIDVRAELLAQIESWSEEYNVTAANELREQAATVETAEQTRELRRVAADWDVVQYRLTLVEDAIEHYAEYSSGGAPARA